MEGCLERLKILLRVPYPAVFVVTTEEDRLEAALRGYAKEHSEPVEVYVWSPTQPPVEIAAGRTARNLTEEPITAAELLEKVNELIDLDIQAVDRGRTPPDRLWVLRDFGRFVNDVPDAYFNERSCRDLIKRISDVAVRHTLILVDHEFRLSSRLEKYVTALDWDLPTKHELVAYVERMRLVDSVRGSDKMTSQQKRAMVNNACEAALGLTEREAVLVILEAVAQKGTLDERVIASKKKDIVRKAGILEFHDATVDMRNVGGLENLKGWLALRQQAFSDAAQEYGLTRPKGILVMGISGCGKSLMAKAVAGSWNMPLLQLDMGTVMGKYVGESESRIRTALKTAEAIAPCVLWIEEVDKSLSSSRDTDGGTTGRVLAYILTWMEEKTAPVFVFATANRVMNLPPEMTRAGRFDCMFFADLPHELERREIIKVHLGRIGRNADDFDINLVAKSTDNFSGAEIRSLVDSALFTAFADGQRPLTTEDLVREIPNIAILYTSQNEEIQLLRRWADGRAIKASRQPDTLALEEADAASEEVAIQRKVTNALSPRLVRAHAPTTKKRPGVS